MPQATRSRPSPARRAIESKVSAPRQECLIRIVTAIQRNEFGCRLGAEFVCHEVPANLAPGGTLAIFLPATPANCQGTLGALQNGLRGVLGVPIAASWCEAVVPSPQDPFSGPGARWYALHTRPQHEKSVAFHRENRGLPPFSNSSARSTTGVTDRKSSFATR